MLPSNARELERSPSSRVVRRSQLDLAAFPSFPFPRLGSTYAHTLEQRTVTANQSALGSGLGISPLEPPACVGRGVRPCALPLRSELSHNMASLLDDLDPYGSAAAQTDCIEVRLHGCAPRPSILQSQGADRVSLNPPTHAVRLQQSPRESTPGPHSPVRLLDLSFLAAVTPRSPERSALIDFSVSPPPPLYPSSQPSSRPDMAPVHLLDESFAVESPIRVFADTPSETGVGEDNQASDQEKENRPLPRPPRKRWSVMARLRDEHKNVPRQSLSPIKDLSPLRAGK